MLFSGTAQQPAHPDEQVIEASGVTAAERDAVTFTAYNLIVHLNPVSSAISVAAAVSVRNDGKSPLNDLPIQISSTLHWESFSLLSPNGAQPLKFGRHRLVTDADHTGEAEEAVIRLPQALAPGATVMIDALYSGKIRLSGARLRRIGAPSRDAVFADWDQISPQGTFLRGFASVLWYPVSANPALLGDGAKLFAMAGEQKRRQSAATIALRLMIEYVGAAPQLAFFNGQEQMLKTSRPGDENPTADAPGSAIAEFAERRLGFRAPSLFVSNETAIVPPRGLLVEIPAAGRIPRDGATTSLQPYMDAAEFIQPMLSEWLGPLPTERLTILEHDGQSFEDQSLLVTPLRAAGPGDAEPALVHSLTHAWFRSKYVWLDEGVSQFLSLLWLERTRGRAAAIAQLEDSAHALAIVDSPSSASEAGDGTARSGQDLLAARDDIYYRNKAAAVLFMLRSIVGDATLQTSLKAYRAQEANEGANEGAKDFQHAVETASGKDLGWFFDDWVYHDRGLPDLSIAAVSPRELPASGGRQSGWLVAVEVANDGGAVADVPITIRSGVLTRTEHLRIPANSKASTRIVFEGTPEELLVNDGSVPEQVTSTHIRQLSLR